MTDETTTRTRRRVRVRARAEQPDNADRRRQRTPVDADDDEPAASSDQTDDTPAQRRVRKRTVSTDDTEGADGSPGETSGSPADPEPGSSDTDSPTAGRGRRAPAGAGSDASSGTARGESSDHGDSTGARKKPAAKSSAKKRGGRNGKSKNGRSKNDAARAGVKADVGTDEVAARADDDAPRGGDEPADSDASGTEDATGDAQASARTRKQRNRKGRRKPNGSPRGGVSEEVRRSVTEGPPRRMLVSVGSQRTEVAVLEERDLVEHYVTRKENESYVGNIYVGRVQNVLPGMEAAFVDIGKGRNGVLYAGEVNYDDEDIESKAPRIEQAIKPGQTVVVQVTKDPMGTKGARLTQQLSLAGRFCVLAIEDGTVGISRKLTDSERDRLRVVLTQIKPEGYGLIVRTAASGATNEQLEADVKRLLYRWEQVQARLADAKPLTELYREPELAMRVIRDVYGPEFVELICDDSELNDQIAEYLEDVSPDLAPTLQRYDGDEPLFAAYEITNQVRRALEKKVWLASGGYLIIEKTEAMWVIDVNTGKFVGESNLEETVLRNNLEAAEEIARQLRLRDMGGIIVIDFVDMLLPANRDEVLKRFKRELARDKTKSRVMEISKLGLVQMTRKNVSQGLTETFTKTCECCEGRGAQIVDKALKR